MERRYKISGMTCAACAAGIQKTVSKMKGVRRAEVSLMGESMVAEFDESAIDSARIVAAVEALGYGAKEEGQEFMLFLRHKRWQISTKSIFI